MINRILLAALLLCTAVAYAQPTDLVLQGVAPKAYLQHTVVAKENWYSVGRVYNISPKDIAPFNGLSMDKGLSPGQSLKIPLTAANFTSERKAGTGEVLVPVYYIVKEKEGLFRVATNAGAKTDQVKLLNSLQGDAVSVGAKLVVGHLKVKEAESPLAGAAISDKQAVTPPPPPPPAPVVRQSPPAEIKKDPTPVVRETPRNNPPAERELPSQGEGSFKADFQRLINSGKSMQNTSGSSGVFKTMSGWQDGKYYVLMDGINPGSIVQVTNPANNKTIYAKVLGEMQELRQNNGLVIRVSNAAASALSAGGEEFDVTVKY